MYDRTHCGIRIVARNAAVRQHARVMGQQMLTRMSEMDGWNAVGECIGRKLIGGGRDGNCKVDGVRTYRGMQG